MVCAVAPSTTNDTELTSKSPVRPKSLRRNCRRYPLSTVVRPPSGEHATALPATTASDAEWVTVTGSEPEPGSATFQCSVASPLLLISRSAVTCWSGAWDDSSCAGCTEIDGEVSTGITAIG